MALAVLGVAPKAAYAEGETYSLLFTYDGHQEIYSTDYKLGTKIDISDDGKFDDIVNAFDEDYNWPMGITEVIDDGNGNIDVSDYSDLLREWDKLAVNGPCSGKIKVRVTWSPIYDHPIKTWNLEIQVDCVVNQTQLLFSANGGSGTMEKQYVPKGVPTKIKPNEFTWDDHKFLGWTWEKDGSGQFWEDEGEITISSPSVIYAKWAAKHNVTVTDDGHGKASASSDKAYESDEVELSVDSADEGYTFDEWEVISGGVSLADDKFTMPDEDVEIKAKFRPISYTVAYDANGGDGQMSDVTLNYDAEKALDSCTFTREGYTFAGWQDGDGNTYEDGATIKNLTNVDGSTITLKAQWTPIAYTVSFDANGGSGTMADQAFTYDVEQALTANAFTREGYTFAGWKGSDGNYYSDGEAVKNLTATDGAVITMVAQWDAIMCTVTFDANGGTGSMDPQTMQYGVPTPLNANQFSREGYTFVCWNTKADGSGTKVADGISLKLTGDVTLYAQWKKDPEKKAEPAKAEPAKAEPAKNAALPKTGDPAPVAATAAAALAGIAALAAGARTRRK